MNVDKTLDRIYDMIGEWSYDGNWRQIDAYIAAITWSIFISRVCDPLYKPSSNDIDYYLGVLSATLPCKEKLQQRYMLYDFMKSFVGNMVLLGLE